jgi:hypothetical protein
MTHSFLRGESAADSAARVDRVRWMKAAWAMLKGLAPYALIELILPGGTVLALICWLYRRRRVA